MYVSEIQRGGYTYFLEKSVIVKRLAGRELYVEGILLVVVEGELEDYFSGGDPYDKYDWVATDSYRIDILRCVFYEAFRVLRSLREKSPERESDKGL